MANVQKPAPARIGQYSLAVLALLVGVAELLSYTFLSLDIPAIRHRVYWPPAISEAEVRAYLRTRDDFLGWPTKGFLETHADADGARLSPANGRFGSTPVCVSTYGDSFTYSDEVGHDDAWPNVLAEHLRCPVKNYGVSGYGIDQAVLRFLNNVKDDATLTILGFYVVDVTRNMNQWRYLMNGANPLAFKPSFAWTRGGELVVEPIPVNSYDDFLRTIENPANALAAERYLPDAPALPAPLRPKFPYTLSLAYFMKNQILDELRKYPDWYDTEDGPWPETIALNTAIVGEFAQKCRRREQRCVVLVVPDVASIRLVQKEGRSELEQFLQPIEQYLEVWRTVEFFARQTERLGVCYYFGEHRDCWGHFNPDGYALLAGFVAEQIGTVTPELLVTEYP
jgi:lysophospholipase L1-like esterase